MTQAKTTFMYDTYIRSTPGQVFDAITRPEIARQYWGHENISDWVPGSKWQHVRATADRPVEIVGEVIEVTRPKTLVTTWTGASDASDPDSYSRVEYVIQDYGSMVRLTVNHSDLEAGSGMAEGVSQGWPLVLSSMKSFLETGSGIDLAATPKAGRKP